MIGLVLGAIALILFGALAYLGVIRRWTPTMRGFGRYLGFACLYWGVSLALFAGAAAVDRASTAHTVLLWAGIAFLFFGILTFLYFPRFLLPRWWKDEHDD